MFRLQVVARTSGEGRVRQGGGDSGVAGESIGQAACVVILRSGSLSATALASRAILRGGTGHAYWKQFGPETRETIEAVGTDPYELLFAPTLSLPVRTLDLAAEGLALAGQGYGPHVLPFVFDLVNLVNGDAFDVRRDPLKLPGRHLQIVDVAAQADAIVGFEAIEGTGSEPLVDIAEERNDSTGQNRRGLSDARRQAT